MSDETKASFATEDDPKVSPATEDLLGEIASRLDEAGADDIQFSGAQAGMSAYLQDRARNVETWDGDNS